MNELDYGDVYEWLWQVEVLKAAKSVYGPSAVKVELHVEEVREGLDNQPAELCTRITGMKAYAITAGGDYTELAPLPYQEENIPLQKLPYENATVVVTVKDVQRYVVDGNTLVFNICN